MKFDDKSKADILQDQFASVFTVEPDGELPKFELRTNSSIQDICIATASVQKKLLELDVDKAHGPDEISPRFLKEIGHQVSGPRSLVFNKSLQESYVPEDWKIAHISHIFKKGAREHASNYRPISLTSIICKIIESTIKDEIIMHLKNKNLLSTNQYGFIEGCSAVTQLLSFLSDRIDQVTKGKTVDTIYFDFSKAFDIVPHRRLLKKVEGYGISGKILGWIKYYLLDRTQLVKVNGISSNSINVLSGIPQGSVLGPILFLVYINDLPEVVKSVIHLFADDTKIHTPINNIQDAIALHEDINDMELWSDI